MFIGKKRSGLEITLNIGCVLNLVMSRPLSCDPFCIRTLSACVVRWNIVSFNVIQNYFIYLFVNVYGMQLHLALLVREAKVFSTASNPSLKDFI